MFKFELFDIKNIPQIVDIVFPLWSDFDAPETYRRLYSELIIRSNLFENDKRFQLTDDKTGEFLVSSFFMCKGDSCTVNSWVRQINKDFTLQQKQAFDRCRSYIELMDYKTQKLMNDDDIQLTLYVSNKKGCGSQMLKKSAKLLLSKGYKTLYLWTDCECDWKWYAEHGFEMIYNGICDMFTYKKQEFKTFIFKKNLLEI